jgi:squalene-hopene/tetraprenyl-beta-curcumene cyclase
MAVIVTPPREADSSEVLPGTKPTLEAAITRSQNHLLGLQRPDGRWECELFVDATLCSDYVAYLQWSGQKDAALIEKCAAHIRRRQLSDGGWNIYEGGPSEINCSVKAYLALKIAGDAPDAPWMEEARANILRLGGIPHMNTYGKLYLALLGQFPWEHLPTIPAEIFLLPRWLPVGIHEMSSWTRAILAPLALLNHHKPTRPLPEHLAIHELYPAGLENTDLSLRKDPRFWAWRNFFLRCDRLLKWHEKFPAKPLRAHALKVTENWMRERMGEGSEGLAAIYPAMLNAMIALEALGYAATDPLLVKAREDFAGLFVHDPADFRIQPCLSPVWDTAITSLALAESGLPGDHPALQKAADWLEDKEVRFAGDWTVKNDCPEPSGWAFEHANVYYPDTDDTMMVLMALRLIRPRDCQRHQEVQARALRWLLSFQCRDGGWAAFDKDVTKRWLEDVPFADHNAILDPTCSDLTARVLELLGKLGYAKTDVQVRRALEMLRRTQEDDGSWYGRWGVNYIYGTWQVLRGLGAIGADMTEPWIQRGRDWLRSCQNEDGGWGETCASYDDPNLKGRGPSTPSQTAWALMGLAACAQSAPEVVIEPLERGVSWLLEKQNSDGSWTENATTGTGFPKVFYLKYDSYRNHFPLLALAACQPFVCRAVPSKS